MKLLLTRGQQPVAPCDRGSQCALPLGEVDRPLHLEREALVERLDDSCRSQDDEARGHELDRQRQAVQAAADLAHRRERVLPEHDAPGGRELDEQRCCVVHRERCERKHVLAREP